MTMIRDLLAVMSDGVPRTARQLADATGTDLETLRNSLKQLMREGSASSSTQEAQYTLSQNGRAKAKKAEERTPQQQAKDRVNAQRMREMRAVRAVAKGKKQDPEAYLLSRKADVAANNARAGKVANSVFNWR